MEEKKAILHVSIPESVKNKFNYLQTADIKRGKQTQSELIAYLIEKEYDNITRK